MSVWVVLRLFLKLTTVSLTHHGLAGLGKLTVDLFSLLVLVSLLSEFLLLLLLDSSFSLSEFSLNLLLGGGLLRHPWVADDVNEVETVGGVRVQHGSDQVFKVITEIVVALRLAVILPEEVLSIVHEVLVVGVRGVSLLKWWVTGKQDEQDDAQGEQISLVTLVLVFLEELWAHVGHCAQVSLEEAASIPASGWGCEAPISNFDVELLIEHDVLGFQVTVTHAFVVCVVHRLEDLLEVSAADWL